MPSYAKGPTRKGKFFKAVKSSWKNREKIGKLAVSAYNGVKILRGLVNSEKHLKDLVIGSTGVPDSGAVIALSAIGQGNTLGTRTGNTIFMRSLQFRGQVLKHASATNTAIRVMIVQDRMTNSAMPTAAQILTAVGTTTAPFATLNPFFLGRFKILYTKIIALDAEHEMRLLNFYIGMKIHGRYQDGAATDEFKNQLYLVAVGSEPTNVPLIQGVSRLGFMDN